MIEKETVLKFLRKNKVATLATVTPDGMPHADTIYFLVEDNFHLFFPTKKLTQKFKNIHHKNDVFLVVTDVVKKQTVSIKGQAFEHTIDSMSDFLERVAAMLNSDDTEDIDTVFPIMQRNDGDLTVVTIRPSSIRYTEYGVHGLQEQTFTL